MFSRPSPIREKEKPLKIEHIKTDKKKYLDLLLLADEQENMIDRYLEQGEMFLLSDPEPVTVCVVLDQGDGVLEIKNLATCPACQKKGYGKAMLDYISLRYRQTFRKLLVGTGDSPLTIPFYERCGFQKSFRVPGFFTTYYDHPIWEGGRQLVDMIYLEKDL